MSILVKAAVILACSSISWLAYSLEANLQILDGGNINIEGNTQTFSGDIVLTVNTDTPINFTADNSNQSGKEMILTGNVSFTIDSSHYSTSKANVIYDENKITIKMNSVQVTSKL